MKINDITEGYKVLPAIDKEKYQPRDGLEGPFRLRNGKVVYYDPQEGSYYDPDTDMYISYDDYKQMDEQGVAEGDKRPNDVVTTKDKPKKIKPSMGGESPHLYQGKLVGEAEVGSTDYQWTHGKKPSGQGSWFFVAHKGGVDFGKDVEGEDYIQLNQMSYADAKKAAIKWAKSKGHTSLFVAT